MEEQYVYWQNSETPFFLLRQISFSRFECYDRKTRTWRVYSDGFREVSLNHECHRISEEDVHKIIDRLQSTDTSHMSYKELCALIK